jgi:hypothetical protein
MRRASTVFRLDDEAQREIIQADPSRLSTGSNPILVDEWQRMPSAWDVVRRSQPNSVSLRALLSGERPDVAGAAAMELADYVEEISRSRIGRHSSGCG